MELWWIILAGCGGGLLLIAYVAFVLYKIVRHRKRKYQRDSEGITDGRDWTVHIHEHFERRVDGLCMDTISGSAKARRKPVILGEEEAVLQSIFKVSSPPNNPKDKHDGPQRTAGDTSRFNDVPAPENTSPEISQRSEYTWENLLRQPSGVRMKRSHTIHQDVPEYRSPIRLDATTRSLDFNRDLQRQQQRVRSKSLRAYRSQEPAKLPFTRISVSEKADKGINKKERSAKSPKHTNTLKTTGEHSKSDSFTDKTRRVSRSGSAPSMRAREIVLQREAAEVLPRERSESLRWIPEPDYQLESMEELVKTAKSLVKKESLEKSHRNKALANSEANNAQTVDKNRKISRSGSAPSTQAKETVVKHETDGPPRKRSVSLRWIPEPDYQSVTVDELVSATQSTKVDIHREATISRDPEVGKLVGMEKTDNFVKVKNESSSPFSKEGGDFVSKFSIPGVAQRMPTEKVLEESHDTVIEIQNEETVLVKDRIQALEHHILPGRPNPGHNQGTPSKRHLVDEKAANLAHSTSNSDSKTLVDLKRIPAAKETRHEYVLENSQTEPSEVSSIGKMKIVKNNETRPWTINQGRTIFTNNTNPQSQPTSTGNATNVHNKADLGSRTSTSDLVKAALRNQTKSKDINIDYNNNVTVTTPFTNPGPSPEDQVVEASDIPPKTDSSLGATDSNPNVPKPNDNEAGLTLEERKKKWKREQLVDQLHSARQRNLNQNYIFGTGLAYQSCMPELQNKLKQLTLTK